MPVEVIGIDHVYVAVRDMERSEEFYDRVMAVLGFRKRQGTIGGDPHFFYYGRHFAYSLRLAREGTPNHDPYAPGLHHFCFRVVDEEAVDRAASELAEAGVEATEPRYYPEYGPDYYATFFEDPDGIRLEVMNFRELRRKIMYDWETREVRVPGKFYSPRPPHRSAEGPG
ncbi:MAG: VOC family protein [Rubrobacter sp.]|nr:VOC family protein [Rubrobacter sp.]